MADFLLFHFFFFLDLGLTFLGWEILACLTMGIGFLFLNPYMNAAYAAFYRSISTGRQEARAYVPPVEF